MTTGAHNDVPLVDLELEVRDGRRGHGPHELEPVQIVPHAFEQPFTASKQDWHEADLHLVQKTSDQELPRDVRSARKMDVFAACRLSRALERSSTSVAFVAA